MKDSPTATFALPQSSFGLVPGGSGGWYALKYLGRAKALDILLHGEFLQPSTALELGLISRLYSEEDFDSEVKAFAEKFAARAPLAMRGIKRLVNAGTNQDQLNFMAQEAKEIMQIIVSEDAQHALDMWLSNPDPEAYTPQFKGK
jgi:enoyl-CoA hydratase/carnithine racemase